MPRNIASTFSDRLPGSLSDSTPESILATLLGTFRPVSGGASGFDSQSIAANVCPNGCRKKGLNAGSDSIVMGMLDREARKVRAKVIPNVKRETLQNEILNQIAV